MKFLNNNAFYVVLVHIRGSSRVSPLVRVSPSPLTSISRAATSPGSSGPSRTTQWFTWSNSPGNRVWHVETNTFQMMEDLLKLVHKMSLRSSGVRIHVIDQLTAFCAESISGWPICILTLSSLSICLKILVKMPSLHEPCWSPSSPPTPGPLAW